MKTHRRPKLTVLGVVWCVCVFLKLLCERSAKRDMGHILYYLTIDLDHAKRDSRLAAYGGVLLQRLELGPPVENMVDAMFIN